MNPTGFGLVAAASASSQPLHVLTLTPFYPTQNDDTGGCFVSEPLSWLEARGISNTVMAVQPIYRAKSHAQPPARWFRYAALPGGLGLSSAGAFVFARIVGHVRQLHRVRPIDLVHAHAPLPCGHAAMLLSRELGIPYVVSVHGLDAFSTTQVTGRAGRWCRRISQRVYQSSRRVICVSERVREQVLEGAGGTCRTSVVYNGVDPAVFFPVPAAASVSPLILSVGNLIPSKGHEVLLRALALLAVEFPAITCEIIGDGPQRSPLEALARQMQISGRIRFMGRQSRHQVAEAMQRCTLFVLPSSHEGLGCVYLEAMSAEKAAIGCRGQGIAEIIQHGWNGFLVGPENAQELKLAMAMLLRDETRRRNIGTAARETILERLTLDHQAENLARIYRESLA
jgi:teichuronic acid biosynthesis glycosyltransferase TuaC